VFKAPLPVEENDEDNETKLKGTTEAADPAAPLVKLQPEQVQDAVTAFSKLLELSRAETEKKSLFSSDGEKVALQVSGIKIPREKERQVVRVRLPHCPLPDTKDICLIVKDLQKGIKVDHEDTVNHFSQLLQEKGVAAKVTQVISLRELKVEYKQYEARNQLAMRFDLFLADDRIIRLLPPLLGKAFYSRKKLPLQVNLTKADLAGELERAVCTSQLPLTHQGSCSAITIGMSTLPDSKLAENCVAVVSALESRYPGGWSNLRSLHLQAGSCSLPLYVSLRSPAQVGMVRGARKETRRPVEDELSTVVGGRVVVTPSGTVRLKRSADPEWSDEEEPAEKEGKTDGIQAEDEEEDENENPKPAAAAVKPSKKKAAAETAEDSGDEMEEAELEYMKKVAEEEEELERQIEENESKLSSKLSDEPEEEESEEEVDDDGEAENLLSEGEDSESEDELLMRKAPPADSDEEEEEATPAIKKSKKKSTQKPTMERPEKISKSAKKKMKAEKKLKPEKKQKKFKSGIKEK